MLVKGPQLYIYCLYLTASVVKIWDVLYLLKYWSLSLQCCSYAVLLYLTLVYTVYPKKYAHGFCFAVLCCEYTLTDFPISIRLTSLALWQSNDCPSASKATLMNMDKYFMWIHYERLHNHNKAKHNKTVCIFLGIYCNMTLLCWWSLWGMSIMTCWDMNQYLPEHQHCGSAIVCQFAMLLLHQLKKILHQYPCQFWSIQDKKWWCHNMALLALGLGNPLVIWFFFCMYLDCGISFPKSECCVQ